MSFPSIDIVPGEPLDSLNALATLLDRAEPRVRRRFLQLVDGAETLDSLEEVAEMLRNGRVADALALTEDIGPGISASLEAAFLSAGLSAAEVVRSQTESLIEFNSTNARSVFALQQNRLRLVREFDRQQREAAQELLGDAFSRGLAPIEQARALKQSIGLTGNQARSVTNFRRLLEEGSTQALSRKLRDRRFDPAIRRAIRDGKPLSPEQIDRMVGRYRDRFIAFRANTIANTETVRALHMADEEMWKQAIDAGVVRPEEIKSQWFTSGLESVRPSHRRMNRQLRPFGVPFISGNGNQLMFPGDPSAPANDTVRCHCVVAREIKSRRNTARRAA